MTAPAPAPPRAGHHIPALDGVRAIAVALVVLTHAAFLTGEVSRGLLGRLLGRGDFGVAVFFALSGFLMYAGWARPGAAPDVRGYAVRRAARVLPAYWLVLAVVVVAARPATRDSFLHALTLQIYAAGSHIGAFSQSWSLATEISFYAVLPLAAVGLARARTRDPRAPLRLLLLALPLALLLTLLTPAADVTRDVPFERWLPARSANFLVGMILAELLLHPQHPLARRARAAANTPGTVLVAGAAAYLLATSSIAGLLTLGTVSGWLLLGKMTLSCVVALSLLVPVVFAPTGSVAAALGRPWPVALGRISYGIFLWHLPVFTAIYAVSGLRPFTGGLLALLALGVPVTIALAGVTHVVIERPAMRWAAGRRRESGAAAPRSEPTGSRTG